MGITGLIPFIEKASRRANVGEFSGCTVAIDSYCWLHKGAFACADKLVRGEETNVHIMYCLKYVMMLISKNIKPILVFDGRHLPAKALTESKRRESREISKKRAAELLSLGKIDEARSYMRRSVDITHAMALALIKECRQRNVDCIVAPYEADAQLAYLNIKNIAHLVITEDSDLILFGCTKVLFKMDLDGTGTLVDTVKLPLVMRCPIEQYRFDKFRQMCIMSGCDYLPSLPGIGLAKARQFVVATQDSNFANALRKLPSFFNRSSLIVTDEYRESFMKAEATFKHQYVYDPLDRKMVRLTDPDDEDIEKALCVNAGQLLDPDIAFQLAIGNLDPFTLKKMDDWHPDISVARENLKTNNWKEKAVCPHPSMWKERFKEYLDDPIPWQKKEKRPQPMIAVPLTRPRRKVVTLVNKHVPETQDESLSIESLSKMYCVEPATKKQRTHCDNNINESLTQYTEIDHNIALPEEQILKEMASSQQRRSPILENKERSFKKLKSRFPRTILGENVVESKFFNANVEAIDADVLNSSRSSITVEDSPEKCSKNPFEIDTQCIEIEDSQMSSSQKENSPVKRTTSPILERSPSSKNPFKLKVKMDVLSDKLSEDSVIDSTYPYETLVTPVDTQLSFGDSPPKPNSWGDGQSQSVLSDKNKPVTVNGVKKNNGKIAGIKNSSSLPSNQPTLLSKFGFQKKPALRR